MKFLTSVYVVCSKNVFCLNRTSSGYPYYLLLLNATIKTSIHLSIWGVAGKDEGRLLIVRGVKHFVLFSGRSKCFSDSRPCIV